jgi:general secretion pathway protein C
MKSRPPLETASIYCLMVMIGFVLADLTMLTIRGHLYPAAPPPPRQRMAAPRMMTGNYGVITSRNIFNSDGKIAPPYGAAGQGPNAAPDAPPVPSQLPIQLMGTLVHANPKRSVATVNIKGKSDQITVKVDGIIPENLATVTKIERQKITFRNNASQRLEYIEMKDEAKLLFGAAQSVKVQVNGEVTVKGDNEFELKRSDINKLTSNLPELLQQARAIPRMGPGGQIECFNLADIQAGSIYERLGLKRGDCIKSVNGEKIDSPAKAMELYNALRNDSNAINLGIERTGKDENLNFSITQ